MLVRIDGESAQRFGLVNANDAHGDPRYYYAASAPALMIIVTHGVELGACVGRVVDATVGWHEGHYGFVRPGNEDRRHSKMTVYRMVEKFRGTPKTLAQILQAAPKEGANVSASEA